MPDAPSQSDLPHGGPRCPICKKPAAPRERPEGGKSPYPFCSERCRLIDLGRWLDGAYQIPADPDDPEDDAAAP